MHSLITVAEAESIICQNLPTLSEETIPLENALGRYLREDICSDRPLPPYDRVMMDGIAINHASFSAGNTTFPIAATQAAGAPPNTLTDSNTCIEVMTGGVLPQGTDCIIPVEEIDIIENTAHLHPDAAPTQHQFIHHAGSDTLANQVLLPIGTRLNAPELTIAASCGATQLRVSKLPSILILSTGDELVAPNETPLPHQIRRSHATALHAAITAKHLGKVESLHVSDDPTELKSALTSALTTHDILVITGGVSRGKYDFVAPILKELLGAPHFHGVAQRPGKPLAFWSHTTQESQQTTREDDGSAVERTTVRSQSGRSASGLPKRAIFALPGNPVSVMACAARYLLPALTQMLSGTAPEKIHLPATGTFNCAPSFTTLSPCHLENGKLTLIPPSNSGNFLSLTGTHGIAEISGQFTQKPLLNHPSTFYPWT